MGSQGQGAQILGGAGTGLSGGTPEAGQLNAGNVEAAVRQTLASISPKTQSAAGVPVKGFPQGEAAPAVGAGAGGRGSGRRASGWSPHCRSPLR